MLVAALLYATYAMQRHDVSVMFLHEDMSRWSRLWQLADTLSIATSVS